MTLRGLEIFKWVCFLKEWRAFIISYSVIRIIGMLMGWIGSNWILLLFINVDLFLCYIWVLLYLYSNPSLCLAIQADALNSSGSNRMLCFQIGLLLDLQEPFLSKRKYIHLDLALWVDCLCCTWNNLMYETSHNPDFFFSCLLFFSWKPKQQITCMQQWKQSSEELTATEKIDLKKEQ